MPEWRQIGPHRYYTEPRMLFWLPQGEPQPDHVHEFLTLCDQIGARHQPVWLVIDQRNAGSIPAAARRLFLDYMRDVRPTVTCLFVHSSLAQRAAIRLLVGAARLLHGYQLQHMHFDSVELALQHVQQQRPPD